MAIPYVVALPGSINRLGAFNSPPGFRPRLCRINGASFGPGWGFQRTARRSRGELHVLKCFHPDVPLPPGPPSDAWRSWLLGMAVTLILPFVTHRWGPLLQIKKQVDTAVETAEEIVEVVEKVAEGVEKVAEDIAHSLPEGGKLRNTVDFVEAVAESIAEDAHRAGDLINKVEEVEEKLEKLIEPAGHVD